MIQLSAEAKRAYLDEGYLLVPGLVDPARIDALLRDINEILKAQLEHHRLPVRSGSDLEASMHIRTGMVSRPA